MAQVDEKFYLTIMQKFSFQLLPDIDAVSEN